ncbi:helix-turn-helix domain-containing protein, partial [Klebsiella pneumoniae]|uniref:helix-turn-helix domain-containing protein n=1 Tax=Klebsiella pneumoniae TaxID=573 RepID=UPI0034D21CDF
REGFTDGERKGDDDSWRLVWLTSPDGRYRIVVGQEWDYRRDMALGMVTGQLVPWLATLPESDELPALAALAQRLHLHAKTLTRLFQRETGLSYQQWCQQWRLMRASELRASLP